VPDEPMAPLPAQPDEPPAESPMAARPRRRHGERLPAAFFVVSMLAGLALAVVYWTGGQTQLEGVFLAISLVGFGGGMVLWAKRFMPLGPEVEPRGPLASTEEEIAAFKADFDVGEYELERRSLLTRLMIGAGAALGIAALFPIRSLGPRPGAWLTESPFQPGTRLVDEQGAPVKPADLAVDGVLTVFPENELDQEYAQTLLIRLQPDRAFTPRAGREDWTPDALVAYSKVCTHVGCPVGLYEARSGQLLCPCHQSTFDVYDGARPVFGPATTSLPQLPLSIDDDGFVVASGPFSDPIGPGFWNQDRLYEDGEY
jgi:ubiquinol-cytochrome c reductase iron-sulfur subunit